MDEFNKLLNVKSIKASTRTLQDIYMLWLCFNKIDIKTIKLHRAELYSSFQALLRKLKNVDEEEVDYDYLVGFEEQLAKFKERYIGNVEVAL